MGTLTKEQKRQVDLVGIKATKRYFDKKGRARFVGTNHLRATGILGLIWMCAWVKSSIMELLLVFTSCQVLASYWSVYISHLWSSGSTKNLSSEICDEGHKSAR